MKPLLISKSKMPLINLYAICCSLRNNIYLSNIMLSPKTWDYLRDINNSQPSLQLGGALKLGFPCGSVGKNLPVMRETWVRSLCWEDPLEKEKATHSSILAWRIPWTIQSMVSQGVGHDWANFTHFESSTGQQNSSRNVMPPYCFLVGELLLIPVQAIFLCRWSTMWSRRQTFHHVGQDLLPIHIEWEINFCDKKPLRCDISA